MTFEHTQTLLTPSAAAPNNGGFHPDDPNGAGARMYPQTQARALEPLPAPVAEVQALRAQRTAGDVLHPASSLYPKDVTRDLALAVTPSSDHDALQRQHVEISALAKDVGMNSDDLGMLAGLVKTAISKPLSAAEIDAQGRQALAELRRVHGDRGISRAQADALALAKRDPRLAGLINKFGLGNHPALVLRMAELGRDQRIAGRLKGAK